MGGVPFAFPDMRDEGMRIRITGNGVRIGKVFRSRGDIVTVSRDEGRRLVDEHLADLVDKGLDAPPAHKMIEKGDVAAKRRDPFRP